MTIEEILARLEQPRRTGDQWAARCPAHHDRAPSLTVAHGEDGRVLLRCHAGCTTDQIVHALGLELRDLFPPDQPAPGQMREVAAYTYVDENGEILYQAVRFEPKTFRQRRPAPGGGWTWGVRGVRRVLYRLPEVLAAIERGDPVYVVEGEKDADAIRAAGAVATCNVGGAGKWEHDYTETLAEHDGRIVVVADRDEPGRKHARTVAAAIRAHADTLNQRPPTVELRQAAVGKDAADHLNAGRSLDELEPLPDDPEPALDPPDAPTGQPEPRAHTWTPIQLENVNVDEHEPDRILGLVYPGLVHLFIGEPETGKSWGALLATLTVARHGHTTIYVDHEMNERAVRGRLEALGATTDELARIVYVRPVEPLAGPAAADILALLDDKQPALVVVDAFASSLATHGLDENANADVEKWYVTVGAALRTTGAALLIVDHVAKDKDSRGGYSIGAQRKKAGADVLLAFETVKPYGRGKTGLARIQVAKDRPGWLPRPKAAELELESDAETGRIAWKITLANHDQNPATGAPTTRPTVLMERVSRHLEEQNMPISRRALEDAVTGNRQFVRVALGLLLDEGYADEIDGLRGAKLVRSIRPYRELEEHRNPTSPDLARPRPDLAPGEVEATSPTSPPPRSGGRGAGRGEAGPETSTTSPKPKTGIGEPGSTDWLGTATLDEIRAYYTGKDAA